MWANFNSLHSWSSSSAAIAEQTQIRKNDLPPVEKHDQVRDSRMWRCLTLSSPGSTTKITCR
jgi:hypothetical protein